VDAADVSRESVRVYAATVPLVDRYPDDPGVLVTLLLNHLVLAPGEAMFVEAGILHAYTSGFGVEIMATSNNVLRAGSPQSTWTSRNSSRLRTSDRSSLRDTLSARGGVLRLSPPVNEFELWVIEPDGEPVVLEHMAPRMAVCLSGLVEVGDDHGAVVLDSGNSVFIEAAGGPVRITGGGRVAVGQTPAPARRADA
jgi:mannose-6-phosphate isomerase